MPLHMLPVRKLLRIRGMDYRFVGPYFVTICTDDRRCIFGSVTDGVMTPNALGDIVFRNWNDLPLWNPWITLDAFIVMPNHIHGILALFVEDRNAQPTLAKPSLGAVMNRFKSCAAAEINRARETPGAPVWQRGYYEHIIRNERSWEAISGYILNNPIHWPRDPENRRRRGSP